MLPLHLNRIYFKCLFYINIVKNELLTSTNVLSFLGLGIIEVPGLDVYR